ncbi:MAG: hypothetical protein ACREUQ_14590 [Burkholderiales bacterium]
MSATRILTSVLIATALSFSVVFTEDPPRARTDMASKPMPYVQYGGTTCVLVDQIVYCGPASNRAPNHQATF